MVKSVTATDLKLLFQRYDADSDGTLNRKELHQLVKDSFTCQIDSREYDWVDDDVIAIANALDSDGDGRIQQAEFVTWILQGAARPKRERKHWANQGGVFQRLDCLLTGSVTIALRLASEAGDGGGGEGVGSSGVAPRPLASHPTSAGADVAAAPEEEKASVGGTDANAAAPDPGSSS